jgi:hypothetical protein
MGYVDKKFGRNCIHWACLNRYQGCVGVLNYFFEEVG